jgi:putative ABC transport system ATP-binding protein
MKELKNQLGTSFIFSTHDPRVVSHADVIYVLEDGQLQTPTAENTMGHGGSK